MPGPPGRYPGIVSPDRRLARTLAPTPRFEGDGRPLAEGYRDFTFPTKPRNRQAVLASTGGAGGSGRGGRREIEGPAPEPIIVWCRRDVISPLAGPAPAPPRALRRGGRERVTRPPQAAPRPPPGRPQAMGKPTPNRVRANAASPPPGPDCRARGPIPGSRTPGTPAPQSPRRARYRARAGRRGARLAGADKAWKSATFRAPGGSPGAPLRRRRRRLAPGRAGCHVTVMVVTSNGHLARHARATSTPPATTR